MGAKVDDTLFPDIHEVLMAYLARWARRTPNLRTRTTSGAASRLIGSVARRRDQRLSASDDHLSRTGPSEASRLARTVRKWMDRIIDATIAVAGEPKPIGVDLPS
ncbi:hypothetical protein GS887_27680 [Rhodococcus hoagii]|nr:hypothetical protein [Prescottella equi]